MAGRFFKIGARYVINQDAIAYTQYVHETIDVFLRVPVGAEGALRPKRLHLSGNEAEEMRKELDRMVAEST